MKKKTNCIKNNKGEVVSFEFFPLSEKLEFINNLKPFFEDSANYFGIYEEYVQKLCKGMGWNRK